ncbi:MAG: arsenate reductase family protein [Bacteriovoracia bacterium]
MKNQLKIYEYSGCSTCRKALKFLETKKIPFEKIDITSQPPTKSELRAMAKELGGLKPLFNTSGLVYRELGLGKKLPTMSEAEQIDLLAGNGRLVKRPFVLGEGFGFVGFKEDEWKKRLR